MIDQERLDAHMNNGHVEFVMCSAIHYNDGKDYYFQPYNIDKGLVFCGWRHPCILQQTMYLPDIIKESQIQGFLTTKNRFLTREEALELVISTGQLVNPIRGGVLTSEDLW